MAMLRIKRDSGYADRLRAYSVILDGIQAGKIGNGEIKEFPIPPGQHELRLKVDWCGSNAIQFAASNNDTLSFSARSNLRGMKLLAAVWYVFVAPKSWIVLERET